MRKPNITSPLRPYVTLDQIMGFVPDDEETWTESHVVNAVCRAFAVLGFAQRQKIAAYLDVDGQALSGALAIATGLPYHRLKAHLQARYYHLLREMEPDMPVKEILKHLGFKDYTGLERFLASQDYKDAMRGVDEQGEAFHAKKRRHYDNWDDSWNSRNHWK